ncbi:DUF1289 domain-containing protein [Stenotrophomonas geniculata]|uniref:DUF1289 domain-containing protein n=1 Tax=Stenotrophomonas geniculata TaxID=86188 RepID=UPI003CCEC062
MEETARVVASPCIGVCTLDPDRQCTGCGRHIDEIARWSSISCIACNPCVNSCSNHCAARWPITNA